VEVITLSKISQTQINIACSLSYAESRPEKANDGMSIKQRDCLGMRGKQEEGRRQKESVKGSEYDLSALYTCVK
jgi:hypothetical protein